MYNLVNFKWIFTYKYVLQVKFCILYLCVILKNMAVYLRRENIITRNLFRFSIFFPF